ncbi:MAG TPA: hypothetical protein VGK17_24310 [Propionicimonas sp.]|jgi:hypothetical protein
MITTPKLSGKPGQAPTLYAKDLGVRQLYRTLNTAYAQPQTA